MISIRPWTIYVIEEDGGEIALYPLDVPSTNAWLYPTGAADPGPAR